MRLTLILLLALSAAGEERVSVETPIVTIAPTRAHLREWCGAAGNYDACTRFVGFRLRTSVAGDGRILASATFRPFIVLRNLDSLPHEHLHIDDVRRSASALVAELAALRFASAEEAQARAVVEEAAFEERMREFARESNRRRHGQ